jgi:hypothetical protein
MSTIPGQFTAADGPPAELATRTPASLSIRPHPNVQERARHLILDGLGGALVGALLRWSAIARGGGGGPRARHPHHRLAAQPGPTGQAFRRDHTPAVCRPRHHHRTDRNARATGPTEALATFVQNLNNPTSPDADRAFGIIPGAIWPTQIWLVS